MTKKFNSELIVIITIILMIFLMMSFLVPFFISLISWPWLSPPFKLNLENSLSSALFTFIFAGISTFIAIFNGLFISNKLVNLRGRLAHIIMSMLLIPILMGSTTWAFLLNNLPFSISWVANGEKSLVLFWMVVAQVWQLSSLAVYMFWLRLISISHELNAFAKGSSFTSAEYVQHITWPHAKSLLLILSVFFIFLTVNDISKSMILAHGSKGLDTQVIGRVLFSDWREHKEFGEFKNFYVLIKTLPIWVLTLVYGFIGAFFMRYIFQLLVRFVAWWSNPIQINSILLGSARPLHAWICLVIVVIVSNLPLILPFYLKYFSSDSTHIFQEIFDSLIYPFIYTLLATIFIASIAIFISSWLRWTFNVKMANINPVSILLMLIFLIIYAIPPASIGICSYWWFSLVHKGIGGISIGIFWWVGITITIIPVMLMFLTLMHFDITRNELDYLAGNKLKYGASFKKLFLRKLAPAYALIYLFTFSFVWNDTSVTQVVSSDIEPGGYILFKKAVAKTVDVKYGYQLIVPLLIFSIVTSSGVGLYAWKKNVR